MALSDRFLNMLVGRPHDKWHFLEESLTIECLNILLEYNCLTQLYWFLLNAEVTRLSVYTCVCPPGLPFHPHPSPLSSSSRSTELNCLRYRAASYCAWGGEYTSIPTSQCTPPSPSPPTGV